MRDFKELSEVDIRMALQSGSDMKVGNLVVKPYILREIANFGYSNYMKNLQWISISVGDFVSSVTDEGKASILKKQLEKLKAFDFYYKLGGAELRNSFIDALKMIFRTDDVLVLKDGIIGIDFIKKGIAYRDEDEKLHVELVNINSEFINTFSEDEITVINRDNFDDLVEVVKLQNYLTVPKKDIASNPVDEMTRKLIEQMDENRKKVESKKKAKQQNDGDYENDIADIISAVSAKSNSVNKFNIWDFTLYQLYDEYTRLELIDSYDFSLKAMIAGAKDIELRHWSSKI